MKILLLALLVAYGTCDGHDTSYCWECVSDGYYWCSSACATTDCSSTYYDFTYCTDTDDDTTCQSTANSASTSYLSYYEYGNEAMGDNAEQTFSVAAGMYCYATFYNGLSATDDDPDPVACAMLGGICSDCKAYWSTDYDGDEDMTEMMEGDMVMVEWYLYIIVFNYGSSSGDFTVTGQNAQTVLMSCFALLASLLFYAF